MRNHRTSAAPIQAEAALRELARIRARLTSLNEQITDCRAQVLKIDYGAIAKASRELKTAMRTAELQATLPTISMALTNPAGIVKPKASQGTVLAKRSTSTGSRLIEGWATKFNVRAQNASGADGYSTTMSAVQAALPAYMAAGAPILEKHAGRVVGTVQSTLLTDVGLWVVATISDDATVRKVDAGELQALSLGFSFGKHDYGADKVLQGLDLTEISLGHTPAIPGCTFRVIGF